MSLLNGSISSALANLANAPQLKDVPEKLVKLSQELGQFGSRLTGVESQVQETKGDLSKVQNTLKELPKISNDPNDATSQVDKVYIFLKKDTRDCHKKIDTAPKKYHVYESVKNAQFK